MRAIRRLLQIVALVGTLIVGVVAVALIVSQTPWFRDWLRRYIVRESKQYLNGELTIGRMSGNLFFGVSLSEVAVDVSGSRVVAVKALEVNYNVFQIISQGVVLDEIKLVEPRLRLERDAAGWNLGRLVKAQEKEAEREGPRRPIELQSIEIADGALEIAEGENGGDAAYRLPERIDDLDVKASFAYAPVHYSVTIDNVSFRTTGPQLTVRQLSGGVAVRDDDLFLEKVVLKTGESSITVDGAIDDYLQTPVLKLATSGQVSLPEIASVVPAVEGYALHPAFDVKTNGPADRLVIDLAARSEAGNFGGRVTADVKAPDLGVAGDVQVQNLNLAPILKSPAQRSDITGTAKLDLRIASQPSDAPILRRMSGTYRFDGPRVVAAGYTAASVRATGAFDAGRIKVDGRADAYGATATASGFIRPADGREPLAFDLRGRADGVNLKNLPAATSAPQLETNLSVREYAIRRQGRAIEGSATLNQSEVEGATVGDGTVGEFQTNAGQVSYAARGSIASLDLPRMGRALKVSALDRPMYEGTVNGTFDVRGSGTKLETMTLDASGTLNETTIAGARLDGMAFDTHIKDGGLDAAAKGRFADLNPARVSGRPALEGRVSGAVDARVKIASLSEPITPATLTANGQVTLTPSSIGELEIERATVQGDYADRVGNIAALDVVGPDLTMNASGRLALDEASESALKYRVSSGNIALLGRLAGQQDLGGSIVLDGQLTGNAASLRTTGTLDGSNLSYQKNNALDLNTKYTVTVPNLTFADATVQATTGANFLRAAGLEINQLTATTTYAKQTLEFETNIKERTRELDAKGSVIFHPDHQEIHLPGFAVRTEGIEWTAAPGSDAAIQYGQNRVTLQDVRLVSGDQTLAVAGSLSLDGEDQTGALEVKAANVDLAQLEQLAMQDRGLIGRLNADAKISGSAKAPIVDGRAEIRDGGFRTYRYESFVAEVNYNGTRIDLDAKLQQSPTEAITAKGVIPTTLFAKDEGPGHVAASAGDQIDVQIQSTDLGLGVIQGFTTAVTNVTGTLRADVRITGSGQDPHVVGQVDIANGAFGVPVSGVSYTGLQTRIDLEPDVVRIQSFMLLDEEGKPLAVTGQLAVHERQVGAVDVNIQTDDFEVVDNQLGDVGVDSRLKITGEIRRPRIEGDVRLQAARIEVDQVLAMVNNPYTVSETPDVVSAERTVEGTGSAEDATRAALARAGGKQPEEGAEAAAPAGEAAPAGAFAPVAMNVHLVIPDNLVLRGKDLRPGGPSGAAIGNMNITVGGDLTIRKEADGPLTLLGRVNTVRGTYEFQGRRFELARDGTLRFTGDAEINPILDVTATRAIPNTGVEVQVHIRGSARKPELELTSTPPLDESDILALILFNRSVNELGTGERASLAATAGGIASGFLAAPLGESIGRALDLDLFEITTTTDEGELGAGLTIGQQIGDRAFFKLRQQFGRQNTSEFLLEYQLADFLRLRASAAPETSGSANRINQRRVERAGIDLIFFFSY